MKKLLVFIMTMATLSWHSAFASDISDWAIEEYQQANSAGLLCYSIAAGNMKGNITREEFCELSVRLYQVLSKKKLPSPDVFPFEDTNNYTVAQAYTLGIVSGVSDTRFAPKNPITREEISKMLLNVLQLCDKEILITKSDGKLLSGFEDSGEISSWAKSAMTAMVKQKIINGINSLSIAPKGTATREQAVAIVNRACRQFGDNSQSFSVPKITSVKNETASENLTVQWTQVNGARVYSVIVKSENEGLSAVYTTEKQTTAIGKDKLSGSKYTLLVGAVLNDGTQVFSLPVDISVQASPEQTPIPAKTEKELRIFDSGFFYTTKEQAQKDMVEITVDVWNINENGEKVPAKRTLVIHKNLAEDVKKIFAEIFADKEKFPIKSCGGFQWRNTASGRLSQHSYGTCIDINPNENYYVSADGEVLSGSYWKPNEDPYSITADGIVVKTFAKYGFLWGGNAWGENSAKDYMHFTYLGN
ncbi:MAG: M15 family metallopeptidase [Clostridia bacterium]|nr:M15 family metallopeptidase [Clostridia bacterium]